MPRRLALLGAFAALLAPLAACGRKAQPEPPEGTPKDAFPKRYPPPGT
jgi:predicted small lipoprotein YifL